MRVLITRPEREATALAKAFAERGHAPVIAPLFQLETLSPPHDFAASLASTQAILLTSANGARALAETTPQRMLRVFAIGETTASTAEGLGFTNVVSADGDGVALTELVRQRLDPKGGPLLHIAGADVSAGFGERLEEAGFTLTRVTLYQARQADALPDSARAALQAHAVDVATFFSPRGSAAFAALVGAAALGDTLRDVTAVAISPATAAPLATLPFKAVVPTSRPTRQAVLDEIDRLAQADAQGPKPMSDKPSPAPSSVPPSQAASPKTSSPKVAPATTPVAPARRSGIGLIAALAAGAVGAVVILAAALATLPHWPADLQAAWRGPPTPAAVPPQASANEAAMAVRLDELDKRIRALANKAATSSQQPTVKADPAVAELRSRLDVLEKRAAAVAAEAGSTPQAGTPAPPTAAPSAPVPAQVAEPTQSAESAKELAALRLEIATLRSTLQALDQNVGAQKEETSRQREAARSLAADFEKTKAASNERSDADRKAMAAARASAVIGVAARLSTACESGLPFAADLALLAPLAHDDPKLTELSTALQPYAQSGVASREALKAEFPPMAKAALADDRVDDSFGERLMGKVRGIVSLRRVGSDVEGDSTEAKLARAEAAMDKGDVAKAVELVKSLPSQTQQARAAWLTRAEAHLSAQRSVDHLSAYAATLLAAAH